MSLREIGSPNVRIISHTQNPLSLMGECASICWDSKPSAEIGKHCMDVGHGRVSEYVEVLLEISDVSIKVGREIYTKQAGNSKLQSSTRYINYEDFGYVVPNSIKSNPIAKEIYDKHMEDTSETYQRLLDLGIPKEDVSQISPLGMETKIVLKINLRSLIDMFEQRLCARAYHEYRVIMVMIKDLLSELDDEWKWICDNHIKVKCDKLGYCPEQKSCGRHKRRK